MNRVGEYSEQWRKQGVPGASRCSYIGTSFIVVEGECGDASVIRSVIGEVLDVVIELTDVEGFAPRTKFVDVQKRRRLVFIRNIRRQEAARVITIKLRPRREHMIAR
jgi:hypothetical protein